MNDFFGWGLKVGEIARIRIRIHWFLLFFWFIHLQEALSVEGPRRGVAVSAWVLWTALSFLSILFHEFGHCIAARKVGGDADEILMWPLGGLAMCHCPQNWRAHLIVAAGGPLVTLGIVAVSWPTFHWLPDQFPWLEGSRYFRAARAILVDWNAFILVFNLIPLYPMDGGRVFHSLVWAWYERTRGHSWGSLGHANRITLAVSRVTGVCGLVYALYDGDTQLAVLFVWAILSAESLRGRSWL